VTLLSLSAGTLHAGREFAGAEEESMERIEPIATALNIQRERAWDPVPRRAFRGDRRSGSAGTRRPTADEVSLVVCLVALVGVLVLGGVLTVFSWVTWALPTTSVACDVSHGCGVSASDDIQVLSPDDLLEDALNRIP